MTKRLVRVLLALSISIAMLGSLSAIGGATASCQTVGDGKLCLTDVSTSDDQLVAGETGTLSISISNEGDTETTASVVLLTVSPTNETHAYELRKTTLQPGESATITKDLNASTPGSHGLQVQLVDPNAQREFDRSDVKTVHVLAEAPARIGGPIDRTEVALAALVSAVVGLGAVTYRQFR